MLNERMTWARIAEATSSAVVVRKQRSRTFFGWVSSVDGHLHSATAPQYQ